MQEAVKGREATCRAGDKPEQQHLQETASSLSKERRPEGRRHSSGDQPDSDGVVRGAGRRNETPCVDAGRLDDALGSQKSEWRMAPAWEEQTQERPHDSTLSRD